MKKILLYIVIITLLAACSKEDTVQNIDVEGYWNVLNDKTFTSSSANSTADLYHLFRKPNAYYRLSFLKTHDFSNLNSKPRADSVINFYSTEGNMLKLTNVAASFANEVPGNVLISRSDNELVFTRFIIERRSTIDGKVTSSRTDTIRYVKVTDAAKVAYFDNFLKRFHP
jgi:hypothetical protein